ncbi:glycine cleavage T C-terminal barrel domain-containing protein [Halomonas alkalisoli]|uniref:glycine cleavage T C-terminal barrel domain-containing protein n=1 Tax=Halomonas alkalisoli TaxID=2907158 RepID=UPI001F29179A|nr:glycine cleavage T C-terminal barrel domain-containing protein [Halomonas alkalisoli]MCE9683299.1 hypothetical protein [Halomonas alkalisoli]
MATLPQQANVREQGWELYVPFSYGLALWDRLFEAGAIPVGQSPLLDPESGKVPVDELGRRSYTTSIAYGPSLGRNIALDYLPADYAEEGRQLLMEYFGEHYPMRVAAVGYRAPYDPENHRPRS